MAGLLCRVVNEESPDIECLTVLDEVEAFSRELKEMKRNDVIVIFYDQLEPVLEVLAQHGAVALDVIDASGCSDVFIAHSSSFINEQSILNR